MNDFIKEKALEIAMRHLAISTLDTQNADVLDFHTIAVWELRAALEEAVKSGIEWLDDTHPLV